MKITIDSERVRGMMRDSLMLSEMESWGVDNWSGMEYVVPPTEEQLDELMEEFNDETTSKSAGGE